MLMGVVVDVGGCVFVVDIYNDCICVIEIDG